MKMDYLKYQEHRERISISKNRTPLIRDHNRREDRSNGGIQAFLRRTIKGYKTPSAMMDRESADHQESTPIGVTDYEE